jgi:photosystem II stability/assembly factor-like uncharacterized protein
MNASTLASVDLSKNVSARNSMSTPPYDTKTFLAANGSGLFRAEYTDNKWQIERLLEGTRINCLTQDPLERQRIYAGTQESGVLISSDGGRSWQKSALSETPVKSLAVSPHQAGTIFAGCKPVSLYVSHDGGESWEELEGMRRARRWWWFSPAEPPDWRAYVQALAISPDNPDVLMAGIELGGVLRSEDGGRTWSGHRKGAQRECHTMEFHATDGDWVYEGGGGGPALSRDGGKTWRQPKRGLGSVYGWAVAADPARPEVWYLSASGMPNMLRGEFTPPAHNDGQANAHIYRTIGGVSWEQLSGGLPEPLDYMAYALITDPAAPGHLYAGLANGDVWHSQDYGALWTRLPFNLGSIQRVMISL